MYPQDNYVPENQLVPLPQLLFQRTSGTRSLGTPRTADLMNYTNPDDHPAYRGVMDHLRRWQSDLGHIRDTQNQMGDDIHRMLQSVTQTRSLVLPFFVFLFATVIFGFMIGVVVGWHLSR